MSDDLFKEVAKDATVKAPPPPPPEWQPSDTLYGTSPSVPREPKK